MFGGGAFARNKFGAKPTNPVAASTGPAKPSAPCKIGQNQLIELKEEHPELMIAPPYE